MKNLLVLALILISSRSFAQQFRVEKVKGNKAVIQFSGASLSQGGTYSIGGGSSHGSTSGGPVSRHYVIGGSFSYFSGSDVAAVASQSQSFKSSDLNLISRFGWNMETYEAGAILKYRNFDSESTGLKYSNLAAGGFFDYNFSPNRSGGDSTIFAVTTEGTFGTYSPAGSSGTSMDLFAGGTVKWFGLSPSFALRGDLGYYYLKYSVNGASQTTSGINGRAGFATYF